MKIAIVLLLMFLLVSCTSVVESPKQVDKVVVEDNQVKEPEPMLPVVEEFEQEVAELIDLSSDISSYEYFFASRVRDRFGNYQEENYDVYIKGNKVKKVYATPKRLAEGEYYDVVYIDLDKKSAIGVCLDKGKVLCQDLNDEQFQIPYQEEKLAVVPLELIQSIDPLAKKINSGIFENRKVDVLNYDFEEGQRKLSVDKYYGLPLKLEEYSYEGEDEILEKSYIFTRVSVNNVKTATVTIS
jgi:hypothetical protein